MTTAAINSQIEVNRPRLLTFLFGFCMFSTGGAGLVDQYVLATMTTYILGNSIEQFSITIASMMLMMGVAGWIQDKVSNDYLIEKFIGIEVLLALLGGFAPIAIYAAFGYAPDNFLFIHYFFVLSIGFLIGFEIPIVMRIIERYGVGIKENLKTVYAMDYLGAFVFAIIWVKLLLKYFPLTEISFIVAGFNFLVAAVTVAYFMYVGIVKSWKIPAIVVISTGILLNYGYSNNRDWSLLMEQKFYDDPIVHVQTTKYQHLVLTEHKKTGDVRLYINGNTQFSSMDEKRYHDMLVHPAMAINTNVKDVLILGGGDGLASRELLKYGNVETITLVDLDPDMVRFAAINPIMRELNQDSFASARVFIQEFSTAGNGGVESIYLTSDNKSEFVAQVTVHNIDADKFVSTLHDKKYDVVIIDFPDPSSIELAKLYSREFYRKLQNLMTDDTIIAIQSTSPYHSKEAYLTIQRTLEYSGLKTLPYHQNIPSFGDWGYFLAWKGKASKEEILQQVSKFSVETEFITPELFIASTAFGKGELLADKDCINSLMQPCLVDIYNDGWQID